MLIVPRVESARARLRSLKQVSFRTQKRCGFSHPNRRCLEHRSVRGSMKAHYARLFADAGGKPCFEDLSVELISGFAVPPAEPLHTAPFLVPDGATFWIGAPPSWNGGEPHPAPRRMIFITVRGEYEVFTGEGEVRKFPLGSILVVEDTTGQGHSSRITSAEECILFAVGLPSVSDT